jgi:hypothetical protein
MPKGLTACVCSSWSWNVAMHSNVKEPLGWFHDQDFGPTPVRQRLAEIHSVFGYQRQTRLRKK